MSTIYGTDMSHYDAAPADLGARLVAEGFSFATHKAGGDADDAELAAWWNAVKAQRGRLLLGAYWVLYPGSPATRADKFIARLDSQCPGWRTGPFILQLDCEIWNGNPGTQPGKPDIKAACDRLKQRLPKLTPVVYASKGQYGNRLDGLPYPLWNANYPSSMTGPASAIYDHVGGDSGPGWGSYSGQVPPIWQFSSSATIAGQTTCDANAYRGALAELTALLAPGWKTEEPDVNLTDKYGDAAHPERDVQDRLNDDAKLRDVLWGDKAGIAAAKLDPASPLAKLIATPGKVDALTTQLAALSAKVDALSATAAPTQEQLDLAMTRALKAAFAAVQA